jgi:hypothetical protein
MKKSVTSKNEFVLAFGGDEFDYSMFALDRLAIKVIYIGAKSRVDRGNAWVSYEFTLLDKALHYADGRPISTSLIMSLSGSPDARDVDSWTARVGLIDDNTGQFVGIGRACLWTEQGYINWKTNQ